jgi:CHAT domain-containing protein
MSQLAIRLAVPNLATFFRNTVAVCVVFGIVPIISAQDTPTASSPRDVNVHAQDLIEEGQYDDAIKYAERILSVDKDKPDICAEATLQLARALNDNNDYKQAEVQSLRALHLFDSLNNQRGVARSDTALADVYDNLEFYPKAKEYSHKAITILESIDPDSKALASALSTEASVYIDLYLFADAEKTIQRQLAIDRKVWGERDVEVGKSLYQLANLYGKMARFSEAKTLLLEVYEIDRSAYGKEEHFQVSEDRSALADICLKMSDLICADQNAREALRIDQAVFGKADPSIADDLEQLALIASQKGAFDEAETLYRESSIILSDKFGADSEQVGDTTYRLAQLFNSRGQYTKALPLFKKTREIDLPIYGAQHAETAKDDYSLGMIYRNLGDYKSAVFWGQQAIDADALAWGKQSIDVAQDELLLATIFHFAQDPDRASQTALEALATISSLLGTRSPIYADALETSASYFFKDKDFQRAVDMGRESLEVYQSLYGQDHPDTLSKARSVASLYSQAGQFDNAQKISISVLKSDINRWGDYHPDVASDYQLLGSIARARQDYQGAITKYEAAVAVLVHCYGENNWLTSAAIYYVANLKYVSGDYTGAIRDLKTAISIEQANGERPFLGNLFLVLGSIYFSRNDIRNSEINYRKALLLFSKTLSPSNIASISPLCNLALIDRLKFDNLAAYPLYKRALTIVAKHSGNSTLAADPLIGLASISMAKGDKLSAIRLLRQVVALYKSKEKTVAYSQAVALLGFVLQSEGQYSEAEKYYKETIEVRTNILGPHHPLVATAYGNFTSLYIKQHHYKEALQSERSNIETLEHTIDSLLSMGSEDQKLKYASLLSRQTSFTISSFIKIPTTDAAQLVAETVLRRKARALDATAGILDRVESHDSIDSVVSELRTQRTKLASLIIDESVSSQDTVMTQGDELPLQNAAAEKTGSGIQSRVTTERSGGKILFRISGPADSIRRKQVADVIDRIEDLESQLSEIRGIYHPYDTTIASIQRILPEKSILIEYFVYRPYNPDAPNAHYYRRERLGAYALTHESMPVVADLGPLDRVSSQVVAFRRAIANRDRNITANSGQLLYERLIKPFASLLEGKSALVISPDGPLGVLPFAALPSASTRYMIQKFDISYVTAARDLAVIDLKSDTFAYGRPVVFADPAFFVSASQPVENRESSQHSRSLPKNLIFGRLEGTAEEGQAVCRLLKCGENLLTGSRATKAAMFSLHSPVVLHIATHGFFFKPQRSSSLMFNVGVDGALTSLYSKPFENPMLMSGLVLAGVNVPGERGRGILTALEMSTVDLTNTQLVVLSACDTGSGMDFTGEGILGLRRSLRLAGAKRELVSLWKVNDDATTDLMTRFYGYFMSDGSHVDALRKAQLELLGKPETSAPFYWASFVADGSGNRIMPGLLIN